MTRNDFSEESLELAVIQRLEELGYASENANSETYGEGSLFERNIPSEVVLPARLRNALTSINPDIPIEAIDSAIYALSEGKSTLNPVTANKELYKLIKDGITVSYKDENGIETEDVVNVIDWKNPDNNDFLVVRQFKISGEMYNCRADLVIFINGLPLIFIELKASHKQLINAYKDNITHYKEAIPQAFWHNAFIVVSNGTESRLGTITSAWEHFADWKKINSDGEQGLISLDTVIKGALEKGNLLDLIENFILYMDSKGGTAKILAKNHQFLGVNDAVGSVKDKDNKHGKLGVFWHTQGSGKSFSMVFLTQKILRKIPGNWTFLIVTDREDLDSQIYKNFVNSGAVTEKGVRAKNRADLKKLLTEDHRNVFTMIQKFGTEEKGQEYEMLSDRGDIIVITDEAHRSQYNVLAMNMRKALPNASFLAFTGTPLMRGDERTKEVFGDYISTYNYAESVEDKATVELFYENRRPDLQIINDNLEEDIKEIISEAGLTDEEEERFEKEYASTYQLITRDHRLDSIAKDVVDHFMNRGFMGKAMYVAIDKATAIKMHDKVKLHWQAYIDGLKKQLLSCSPSIKASIEDKVRYMEETDMAVIVSSAQNEIETLKKKGVDIKPHRERSNKEELDVKFKKPEDPLRIVFVCAMWITGFDAPAISTLYLDKILKDHTLMQTIARANRVWGEKPSGIIVDYIGIFKSLQKALAIYGNPSNGGEGEHSPVEDKEALVTMLSQSSKKMDEYLSKQSISNQEIYVEKDNFVKIQMTDDAVDRILHTEDSKQKFLELTSHLQKSLKAVLPDVRAESYLKQSLIVTILTAKVYEITKTLLTNSK